MAGYSSTPLVKKLGIKSGQRVVFVNEPKSYRKILKDLPDDAEYSTKLAGEADFIQIFAINRSELQRSFPEAKKALAKKNGALWVSWPKRSSGLATDLDENVVRDTGLALGLVDVKVCAVDDTWSGLKFVYRLKDR